MNAANRHPASYRDPDSSVLVAGNRILRGFNGKSLARYRAVCETGVLEALERDGLVVASRDVDAAQEAPGLGLFAGVIEHDALPFISHPYEWPFALLQRAALLHLEVHLRALERGVTLADASAYNVQFRGVRPVFIDLGSFRPYEEGELWSAHKQFCEHFLNPLLLGSEVGIEYNTWLRGSLEGIATSSLARLLSWRRWFSTRHLFHVLLPARAEKLAAGRESESIDRIRRARLPIEAYRLMLLQLRNWIEGLRPANVAATTWSDYARTRAYHDTEIAHKRRAVAEFAAACRPGMLWDMGCNDGEFAEVALRAGAQSVVGFDADAGALHLACERARKHELDFLPLVQDAADPSPARGWRGRERASFFQRAQPQAMMALAFEHHLALGRNIPLEEVVDFLVGLAPCGLVEFVPKGDPTIRRMLALKGDLFPNYGQAQFEAALVARARVTRNEAISESGRRLYWFER